MFDFEEWSNRLYQIIEEDNDSPRKDAELQSLWEELFQQKDNSFVQFLDQLLVLTEKNMDTNNEQDREKLEKLVDNMRENVLERQVD